MAQPDFLVIGAQKAGTTWLDKMFKSHPEIWTPVVKELQFFNSLYMEDAFKWTPRHRSSHASKAIGFVSNNSNNIDWAIIKQAVHIGEPENVDYQWYETVFDFAPEGNIKGEMTPEYSLLQHEHINSVKQKYPNLKIIFVMRDPVQRALSGIRMRLLQNGFDASSTQSDIDNFVKSCASDWDVIERGNYQNIIDKWTFHFGDENFLPLLSDDLKIDGKKQLEKLSKFLGIESEGFVADASEKVHVGKKYHISQDAIDEVIKYQQQNLEWFERYRNDE
ncbi:sulfotransferase [uncultured Alteromonas sp.]|mgnify:CR=1 FL=1|uniref:sulfotransferase family protein n=1 Tax=uncultured Alteromonas sp. TaxID=179113 RepID=UPI0030D42642|tara:strand:- start:13522 stop:14352 length:831 start_codon:yes stop_codon:yes gene_type:complete